MAKIIVACFFWDTLYTMTRSGIKWSHCKVSWRYSILSGGSESER